LVALLCEPGLALGAERFDLARSLQQLGYEVVELRRTPNNHLFLFGQVDGRKRSCLVDTGWSFTTISTNTAARLAEPTLVRQLTLGLVVLTNEIVRTQDLRVNGQPTSYDVVLGMDFLRHHQAVIDCTKRRLYLRRIGLSPTGRAELERGLIGAGWSGITMKLREPLALTCRAQVNGDPVDLLVDSGATWSCLDATVADSLGLRAMPSLNRMMGPAATGARNVAVADLRSWQLETQPMRATTVAVFGLKEWGLGPDGE
jgi:predicted aspartyl protease